MTKQEIIEHITMQDFDLAIDGLKAAITNTNDVILVAARWKGLERDMRNGLVTPDYAARVRAQISAAMLDLAQKIPDDAPEAANPGTSGESATGGAKGKPKVFISYNHKDAEVANRMRDFLKDKNVEVTIDSEAMRAGEDIKSFIERSIRDTDVTLSLVSTNSLLSAWVGMETLNTLVGEGISDKKFIPVSIQSDFFDPSFVTTAIDSIDQRLEEIKEQMMKRIAADIGIEDLQNDRTRYKRLKNELPSIVGTLKERLTLDISGDKFDSGMERVAGDL